MKIPASSGVGSYTSVDSSINELSPLMKAFPLAAVFTFYFPANKYLDLSESDTPQIFL